MEKPHDAARAGLASGVAIAVIAVALLTGAAGSAPTETSLAYASTPSHTLSMLGALLPNPEPEPAPIPAADPAAAVAAVVQASASVGTSQVLALVKQHFPADQVGNAMAVARCESGHSNAVGATNSNGTTDWGVFQLNDGGTLQGGLRRIGAAFTTTAEAQQLALDAETNVRAARTIYDNRGWAPWVCAYKTGIVAGLYSSTPGPMNGRYDERGLSTTPFTAPAVQQADVAATPQPVSATPRPSSPGPSAPVTPRPTPAPAPPTPAPRLRLLRHRLLRLLRHRRRLRQHRLRHPSPSPEWLPNALPEPAPATPPLAQDEPAGQ